VLTRRRALLAGLGAGAAGLAAALGLRGGPSVPEGTVRTVDRYGDADRQDGEWWVPPGATGRLPTVVLVHGGYWRAGFDRSLEDGVAADLVQRGFLVWNLDYRSGSQTWPATLQDTATAYDLLATGTHAGLVDPDRVAVVGHSAGGHLALWLTARHRLPAGAPGAGPRGPRPSLGVPQAPVAALADGARQGLGAGAVQALVGGEPHEVPERYAVADPVALLPTGVPSVLLHAEGDDTVPLSQSRTYVRAATAAGDDSALVVVPGGHFEHLDPGSAALAQLRMALRRL
jgi:acetyl esterase/lipase